MCFLVMTRLLYTGFVTCRPLFKTASFCAENYYVKDSFLQFHITDNIKQKFNVREIKACIVKWQNYFCFYAHLYPSSDVKCFLCFKWLWGWGITFSEPFQKFGNCSCRMFFQPCWKSAILIFKISLNFIIHTCIDTYIHTEIVQYFEQL